MGKAKLIVWMVIVAMLAGCCGDMEPTKTVIDPVV